MKRICFLLTIVSMAAYSQASFHCVAPVAFGGTLEHNELILQVDASNGSWRVLNNAGRVVSDSILPERARLLWVVINKNPFRYQYAAKADIQTVAETDLTTFLGFLGPLVTGAQAPAANAKQALQTKKSLSPPDFGKLEVALDNAIDSLGKAAAAVDGVQARYNHANGIFASATAIAAQLVKEADSAYPMLAEPTAVGQAQTDIGQLHQAAVDVLRSSSVKEAREYAQTILDYVVPSMKADMDKLSAAVKKFADLRLSIESVCGNANSFVENTAIERNLFEARTLKLTDDIHDTAPNGKDRSYTHTFQSGSQRFFLTGGLVGTTMDRPQYDREAGFERDFNGALILTNGQPTTGTIVGFKENSGSRLLPIVLLNCRLVGKGVFDLHAAVGVTAKFDDKGTDVEVLIGPSLSLWRKLFFTVGAYAGHQQTLDGRFYIGAPVPATVTDLSPTKQLKWSPGFALSYKIR